MRRALAMIAASMACTACATVDLAYVDASADAQPDANVGLAQDAGVDAVEGSAPSDAGPINVVDGDVVGADGTCACASRAGVGCCVPAGGGAAFCTDTGDACMAAGGVFIGCASDDSLTESVCCWNGGVGSRASTALSTACSNRPHACATNADCALTTCQTTTCGGVTVGACGVAPACP